MTFTLAELLNLTAVGDDRFTAQPPAELGGAVRGGMFGGAVLAIITRAACLTVAPDRRPHALHNLFGSAPQAGEPLTLTVERTSDTRSFSSRSIVLSQGGSVRCSAIASFSTEENGHDVGLPQRADAPRPGTDYPRHPVMEGSLATLPFRIEEADVSRFRTGSPHDTSRMLWVQLVEELDPALLPCVLAYISDFGATIAARALVGATHTTPGRFASLDHSLWWRAAFQPGEWLLVDFRPLAANGARGLVSASIHTEAGVHVGTVVQEALMRINAAPPG